MTVNDPEWDQIERVLDVNLCGALTTVKAFLPELLTRPAALIVNVGSPPRRKQ